MTYRGLIAVAVVAAGLAACQTASEAWTEWKPITEQESRVALVMPAGATAPDIQREARSNTVAFVKEERWWWQSGAAYMSILPRTSYMRADVHDTSVILEDIADWRSLSDMELKADASMVQQGTNEIGVFHYLISDENNAGMTCFVFRQMLPMRAASGYQDLTHGSGGFLAAFDCQPTRDVTPEKFKAQMIGYVQNFNMNG